MQLNYAMLHLFLFLANIKISWHFLSVPTLQWHRPLKFTLVVDKDLFILYDPNNTCWWLGNAKNYHINSYGIGLVSTMMLSASAGALQALKQVSFQDDWLNPGDIQGNGLHSQIPECTCSISHNALFRTCSEWSIVGYGTGAFWDLWNWSIVWTTFPSKWCFILYSTGTIS